MVLFWLLLGLALATPYVLIGRRLGRGATAWWAAGLVVAALVYVGFAAVRGAPLVEVGVELAGAVAFGAAAVVGWRRRDLRVLAAAWALHPAWDLGVHLLGGFDAPEWYVWACLSFDLAVASALLADVRRPAPRRV